MCFINNTEKIYTNYCVFNSKKYKNQGIKQYIYLKIDVNRLATFDYL
jgi:hypothetical protein